MDQPSSSVGSAEIDKWQALGLSLLMLSERSEDFYEIVKQEFGYIWDGKGWQKLVSYQ